jgi:hypothetical protein
MKFKNTTRETIGTSVVREDEEHDVIQKKGLTPPTCSILSIFDRPTAEHLSIVVHQPGKPSRANVHKKHLTFSNNATFLNRKNLGTKTSDPPPHSTSNSLLLWLHKRLQETNILLKNLDIRFP